MRRTVIILLSLLVCAVLSSCGYNTTSMLAKEYDSVHVGNFANKIDPSKEISDKRSNYTYRPGLETDITRSVIDRFIFDRNIAIKSEPEAALLLKGALIDLREYPLSYDKSDNIEEFRIELYVSIELYDNRTDKLIWKEPSFMGQSTYTVSGPNAKTESQALNDAVKDLAQRVVERTVEAW